MEPKPMRTNKEGIAQQMSVPKEVNKENQPMTFFIFIP